MDEAQTVETQTEAAAPVKRKRGRPVGWRKNKAPAEQPTFAEERAAEHPAGGNGSSFALTSESENPEPQELNTQPEPVAPADEPLPAGYVPETTAADDEYEIRERAVKMGLMGETIAATLPLADIRQMIADAKESGVPDDTTAPATPAPMADKPSMTAVSIIERMLGVIAEKNGLGLPMPKNCSNCWDKSALEQAKCVCVDARRYLEVAKEIANAER